MKYVFCVRGMDITRKSVTGPGCTLTALRKEGTTEKVIVQYMHGDEVDRDRVEESLVEMCSQLIAFHTKTKARKVSGFVDELGRCVVFHRGMAIGALIPEDKYAGFLFCPKLQAA